MVLLTDFGFGSNRTFWEPRVPITGISAKLTDLVHSVQFSMVLLTDVGPRVDSDVWGTPGSAYGDITKTHRFGPFWPVFYGINH
jgi:hypothetical protein